MEYLQLVDWHRLVQLTTTTFTVGGALASVGAFWHRLVQLTTTNDVVLIDAWAFSYIAAAFKSAFIKTSVVSSITSGLDIGNDFKDKFVEQGYTTITEANAQDAFKNVSNDKLI